MRLKKFMVYLNSNHPTFKFEESNTCQLFFYSKIDCLKTTVNDTVHQLDVLGRIFEGLSKEVLATILHTGNIQQLEPGEYLFRQGSIESNLYIVLNGRLRAVLQDKTGIHILG